MPTLQHRLIISFVGNMDIDCIDQPDIAENQSPIWRLVREASALDSARKIKVTIVLLLDRKPIEPKHKKYSQANEYEFKDKLTKKAHALLPDIKIRAKPMLKKDGNAIDGPTRYDDLYIAARKYLEGLEPSPHAAHTECWFHVTSGTPAMHVVLHWLACSYGIDKPVRLWETGRESEPRELRFPVSVAIKATPRVKPIQAPSRPPNIPPYVILNDIQVLCAYQILHHRIDKPGVVVISGPTGSGKRTAARQVALWRSSGKLEQKPSRRQTNASSVELEFASISRDWLTSALKRGSGLKTIVIHSVNAAHSNWNGLMTTLNDWPDSDLFLTCTLALTCDNATAVKLRQLDIRPAPTVVQLPALKDRDDITQLALAMLGSAGRDVDAQKFSTNFDADFKVRHHFPDGLWTLRNMVALMTATNGDGDISAESVDLARHLTEREIAQCILEQVWTVLASREGIRAKEMDIVQLLDAAKHATMILHGATLTDKDASVRFGYNSPNVYKSHLTKSRGAYDKMIDIMFPDQATQAE